MLQPWDIGIACVKFEDTNEGKSRPVLVLCVKNNTLVAFKITSRLRTGELEYSIKAWREAGLDKPSYVRLTHKVCLDNTHQVQKNWKASTGGYC